MYRRRRNQLAYERKTRASGVCDFCDPAEIDYRLIEQTDHSYVIPNAVPYDYWEHHRVVECLMVIPKRHAPHFSDLNDAEMLDLMKVIARYESNGYNVYARAPKSVRRTQTHQHTHLIKIDPQPPRFTALLMKPYFLIRF